MNRSLTAAGSFIGALLCCVVATANEFDDAVRRGDVAGVQALLREDPTIDLEVPARDGLTALLWAAQANNVDLVRALLDAGADASGENRYGMSPLWFAALNRNADLIELLLDSGANAAAAMPHGETALMAAARAGDARSVRALAGAGADPNAAETATGETGLIWAAAENHADAVRALIVAGADPDLASDELELAPMNWVQVGMVSTVLPVGGWAPLLFAARENAQAAALALIEHGADADAQDPEGNTALLIALANDHFDMAAVLLEAGADPNVADRSGMNALYAAVERVTAGPDFGRPPLPRLDEHTAADLVRLSIEHGADVNARLSGATLARHHGFPDRSLADGGTALMRAARGHDLRSAQWLIAAGADAAATKDDGANAVHALAGTRVTGDDDAVAQAEMFALLVAAGADADAAAANGETPLHRAARSGNTAMIGLLAGDGADLDARNDEGQRAVDIVTAPGRFENAAVAALLNRLAGE